MQEVKFRAGNRLVSGTLDPKDGRIIFKFPFNKTLISEFKAMDGARWNPEKKYWHVTDNSRNRFAIDYLMMKDPYKKYRDLSYNVTFKRNVFSNQRLLVQHALSAHCVIWAAEMGLGKTLAAIEVMEHVKNAGNVSDKLFRYVGPKSGVKAVERELVKWQSRVQPVMMTYERFTKAVEDDLIKSMPLVIVFDESQKIKNPMAKRSRAALYVAEEMRKQWGDDCYIILMTGTPAPRTPADWWHQCEVACPGYLKEGNINKFKKRLALIKEQETLDGVKYPEIVTWFDDENKCAICGQQKEHESHDLEMGMALGSTNYHEYKKSVNEVANLYKRLKGLVSVQFKKDFLDLPEKQYEVIRVLPEPDTIRAMKLIKKTARRAIEALTLLRELSDGFQYTQTEDGEEVCPNCNGKKNVVIPVPDSPIDTMAPNTGDIKYHNELAICDCCGGLGKITKYIRNAKFIACPKDQVFIDDLDECEEVGRYIVWGGFTATVDRLVAIAHKQQWATLRIDGRGYDASFWTGEKLDPEELLTAMDGSSPHRKELLGRHKKVVVIGNPEAGGMALTLTMSPIELYYSNSFSGVARMQSEERFHRIGMDTNRGAIIKDIIHLPTDELIINNLKKKKDLQSLSMGEVLQAMEGI